MIQPETSKEFSDALREEWEEWDSIEQFRTPCDDDAKQQSIASRSQPLLIFCVFLLLTNCDIFYDS